MIWHGVGGRVPLDGVGGRVPLKKKPDSVFKGTLGRANFFPTSIIFPSKSLPLAHIAKILILGVGNELIKC